MSREMKNKDAEQMHRDIYYATEKQFFAAEYRLDRSVSGRVRERKRERESDGTTNQLLSSLTNGFATSFARSTPFDPALSPAKLRDAYKHLRIDVKHRESPFSETRLEASHALD